MVTFLGGLVHVSFKTGGSGDCQFVPGPAGASPANDRNVGAVFIANYRRRPLFTGNFGGVLQGLFCFCLFRYCFCLYFPRERIQRTVLFVGVVVRSLLLSFRLRGLSGYEGGRVSLPFFYLDDGCLEEVVG